MASKKISIHLHRIERRKKKLYYQKMHVVCIRMLLSASICLSTLQKQEGGFVLILKPAWGVLSTLYFWAWGVLSAFKKTCGGFRPPITKRTWGVLSVGCFVLHSTIYMYIWSKNKKNIKIFQLKIFKF